MIIKNTNLNTLLWLSGLIIVYNTHNTVTDSLMYLFIFKVKPFRQCTLRFWLLQQGLFCNNACLTCLISQVSISTAALVLSLRITHLSFLSVASGPSIPSTLSQACQRTERFRRSEPVGTDSCCSAAGLCSSSAPLFGRLTYSLLHPRAIPHLCQITLHSETDSWT